MKILFFIVALAALAKAEESDNTMEMALSFVKDCKGDVFICVKEKVFRIVENLRSSRSIVVADGIVFKANPTQRSAKGLNILPTDPDARDTELNFRIYEGVVDLFENTALEVKMNPQDKEVIQRSLEEARGKKKGQGMGALIGLLGAKVLLGKLFIVKLIALKALATAKIALVLGVILFVAWCLKSDHTKTTYEVVPHAHHHEAHHPVHVEHSHASLDHGSYGGGGYGGSDWNKNLDEAQNLAYSGYSGHSRK